MRASDLESVKSRLQQRRSLILEASRRTGAEIDQLRGAERDPEVEEGSQSEQQQFDLSQIGEVERRQLEQIDAALQRIEGGQYGLCRDCGEAIGADRLEAVPFALDCPDCAARREEAEATARGLAGRPRIMNPE